jgi:uncharacterized protein YdhG (YjbR/CyaY superfamily)
MQKTENIDAYIARHPQDVRERLQQIRSTIRSAAPGAEEAIRYGMPTFVQEGTLVHFAAFSNHIGLYAFPTGIEAIRTIFEGYSMGKGSIQLPLNAPLPLDLIAEAVRWRVKANKEKARFKKEKKRGDGAAADFMAGISAPACRALTGAGITTLKKLSGWSEKELLRLHGFGKASLPFLRKALAAAGMQLKEQA